MVFELSIGGFFKFLIRPLTNPIGIILLLGAVIWIFLRITGRIQGFGKKRKGSNTQTADYIIK